MIGGSCGLLLQSVPIGSVPNDLDIYVDAREASLFHRALRRYAADEQQYSETDKYCSVLSHYHIGDVAVELVAGFTVKVPGALYRIDIANVMKPFGCQVVLDGTEVGVMPLAHELLFNVLRDRPDRYEAVAETMRKDLSRHLPALKAIVAMNELDGRWLQKISSLLGCEIGGEGPEKGRTKPGEDDPTCAVRRNGTA